jgi:uncharacterized MAPEG superfamily protein
MSPTILAFGMYIAWILLLLVSLGGLRTSLTLSGKKAPNSFDPSGADVSPFSNRLCRAHANCYESFPIFGGLLILAIATDTTAITDGLAYYLIGARVLQSVTHLASTSNVAVLARFAFFGVQIGIAVYWLIQYAQL